MASTPLPALSIHTEGESPINLLAKAQQIKGAQQSQEMGAIQLQQARMQQQSNAVIMQAIANHQGNLDEALAEATGSGKALPQDLLSLKEKSVALQTAMLKNTEAQNATIKQQNELITNAIDSVKALPVEQRGQAIINAVGDLGRQGVDISKGIPAIQALAKSPTDEAFKAFEVAHMGATWANTKATEEYVAATRKPVSDVQKENALDLQKKQVEALAAQRAYDNMATPLEAKTERAAKILEEQSTAAKNFAETAKIKAETALAQQGPVEGTDPTTKTRVVVPRAQAGHLINATPLTAEQFQKESNMSGRFGSVAQNYGKYEVALKELGKIEHPDDIAQVISDQTLGNNPGLLHLVPSGGLITGKEVVKATSDAWNKLNPDERRAAQAYLQVVGGIITYNKAVDDTGRANEVAIHLEKSNIPTPLEEKHIALQHLQGNKDNIRTMIPVIPRFDHMEDPNEYLKSGESVPIGERHVVQAPGQKPLVNLGMPDVGLGRAVDQIGQRLAGR